MQYFLYNKRLKNGCGAYWGRKANAKKQSNRKRREQDKILSRKENGS